MNSKRLDEIKKLAKSLDITPRQENIHVLNVCTECGLPGIETNPFAPHAEGCSKKHG